MTRTKIAPTLRSYVEHGEGDPYQLEKTVRAELRALLAVASAARMHSHAEVPFDPIDESKKCGICRALARLDRLSSPPSRRGGLRKGSTVEGNDTLPANSRRTARGTKEKIRG